MSYFSELFTFSTNLAVPGMTLPPYCFTTIFNTLGNIFRYTVPAQAHIPAFVTPWGFSLASDSPIPSLPDEEVDHRVDGRIVKPLRFYDGETHRGMFALPKFLRDGIQQEKRINRDSAPVFMV